MVAGSLLFVLYLVGDVGFERLPECLGDLRWVVARLAAFLPFVLRLIWFIVMVLLCDVRLLAGSARRRSKYSVMVLLAALRVVCECVVFVLCPFLRYVSLFSSLAIMLASCER